MGSGPRRRRRTPPGGGGPFFFGTFQEAHSPAMLIQLLLLFPLILIGDEFTDRRKAAGDDVENLWELASRARSTARLAIAFRSFDTSWFMWINHA